MKYKKLLALSIALFPTFSMAAISPEEFLDSEYQIEIPQSMTDSLYVSYENIRFEKDRVQFDEYVQQGFHGSCKGGWKLESNGQNQSLRIQDVACESGTSGFWIQITFPKNAISVNQIAALGLPLEIQSSLFGENNTFEVQLRKMSLSLGLVEWKGYSNQIFSGLLKDLNECSEIFPDRAAAKFDVVQKIAKSIKKNIKKINAKNYKRIMEEELDDLFVNYLKQSKDAIEYVADQTEDEVTSCRTKIRKSIVNSLNLYLATVKTE